MREQSLRIDVSGLTRREFDDLAAALKGVPGVGSVSELVEFSESHAPFQIQASALHAATLLVAFAAGQLTPGVQEFTKAVGKKVGDAVGDALVGWFKKRFSGKSDVQASVVLYDENGEPIQKLKGRR